MTTHQRRRGIPAKIWKTVKQKDNRGNTVKVPDATDVLDIKVWIFPQRSARAEVPGQAEINVIRIGTTANLAGVEIYSRVEFMGKMWDCVTPPSYHHGTRHTRHWSIDLRERP